VPQQISVPNLSTGMENLQLRFFQRAKGDLIARNASGDLRKWRLRVAPERRVLIPIRDLGITAQMHTQTNNDEIELCFKQSPK
jgi:hypothetical protein